MVKGYERSALIDDYQRYVKAPNASTAPAPRNPSATPLQTNEINDLDVNQSATLITDVADGIPLNPLKNNDCSGVADGIPPRGQNAHVSGEMDGGPVADDWGNEL